MGNMFIEKFLLVKKQNIVPINVCQIRVMPQKGAMTKGHSRSRPLLCMITISISFYMFFSQFYVDRSCLKWHHFHIIRYSLLHIEKNAIR